MIFRQVRAIPAVAILLVTAGCGSGAASPSEPLSSAPANTAASASASAVDLTSLYAQAKPEGSVSFYCASAEVECNAIAAAFNTEFPDVKVNVTRLASSQLSTRFAAEKSSHADTADLFMSSDLAFLEDALSKGMTANWEDANVPNYPGSYPAKYISEDFHAPFEVNVEGIAWNTDLVPAGSEPKAFMDLTDPKWKGKICSASPAASAIIPVLWGTLADAAGEQLLTGLSTQAVDWEAGGVQACAQKLAAGEMALDANAQIGGIEDLIKSGAPLDWSFPEIVTGVELGYAINAEPAHPNAARLFAAFLLTPAAGQAMQASNPGSSTGYAGPSGVTPLPLNLKYLEAAAGNDILTKLGLPPKS
jgi:iron(III) transport system substrate-binding protein